MSIVVAARANEISMAEAATGDCVLMTVNGIGPPSKPGPVSPQGVM